MIRNHSMQVIGIIRFSYCRLFLQKLVLAIIVLHSIHRIHAGSFENDSVGFASEEYPSMSVQTKQSMQCLNSCSNGSLLCSEIDVDTCPPGLFCKEGHCECGVFPDRLISCNGISSFVLRSSCVTFDENTNLTLVGNCLRSVPISNSGVNYVSHTLYHQLPRNVHQLNGNMCGSLNRTGALCGRCLPDHYPLAYSFNMTCIPCPHTHWNWFKYIMAAYLPLTFFYVIILFFKINTTSSHLFAVVYYCQTVSMPFLLRNLFLQIIDDVNSTYIISAKTFFSIYGIWNLDFGRPFYSDLCLGIGVLPTLALDYAIAVYPLLLMIISYLLIVLHDKNYRVVTIMWSPFRILFSLFRRNWNIRTSVIDAYATFFYLSNIKFLSVCFDMLAPTQVYQLHGDHYNYTLGLFYAGDVEYFGKEHLPYALVTIVILCLFIILPAVFIALFSFSFFQKLVNLLPFRWRYAMHIFVHSFQGCYKDGAKPGTRDYRWFASLFFFVRLFQFLLYFLTDKVMFISLSIMVLVLYSTLMLILQPFKSSFSHYNVINIVLLQFLALFGITAVVICFAVFLASQFVSFFYVLAIVFGAIPFLYLLSSSCHWIYTNKKIPMKIFLQLQAWRSGYDPLPEIIDEGLPDRLENSGEYPRENLANFTVPPAATELYNSLTTVS